MQSGRIFRKGPSWYLQFRRSEVRGGTPVRVQAVVKLAGYSDTYRNVSSVRKLAAPYLERSSEAADLSLTLNEFIEKNYFPSNRTLALKPSTIKGYRDIFKLHIEPSIGKMILHDFKVSTAQNFFDESLKGLSHQTCLRIRAFLSGVFTRAIQTDVWIRPNPIKPVKASGSVSRPKRRVNTFEEVAAMMKLLPEPARTVVGVAAFTGLREGEIRGLRWKDYDGSTLTIERSVWRTHVHRPKTADSAGSVPVIPYLAKILDEHRRRSSSTTPEGYIFKGEKRGFALNLDNLSRRIIAPTVGDLWKGWHAFRRGLGTNLNALGVDLKTISELLRHGSTVTAKHYLVIDRSASENAMLRIENLLTAEK